MDAPQLARFLDRTLKVADFHDDSHNGLQVENRGDVTRIACGVDASQAFFEDAVRAGANFLICHHGLSWGDSLKRITHLNYRRIDFLMRHNVALYACHLPLDAHRTLGNNAQIGRALGLMHGKPFGRYHGAFIGLEGRLPSAMRYAAFKDLVAKRIGAEVRSMDFGKPMVRRIAVVSGGAAELVEEAAAAGADVFLSGEPKLMAHALAQELGIHAIFAGHYATEVFGVRAVGAMVKRRFRIPAAFIRHDVAF
ncbi:MAG: Nif3-like dinuclear metal center hexameric protein [Lentisphaerae bacterium]|nr:Nif3-like dinuclear metal center hexameric protein [Lentisphaerota bacterium]